MNRAPLRRTANTEKRRLELQADRLWALLILARSGSRCERCGKAGCQAAHILPRSHKHWRHHPKNGLPLCPGCHAWGDQHQTLFHAWLLTRYPDRWAMLAYRHEDRGPVKAWMLRECVKELKNQLDGSVKN